jgi:hypothetical protein
LKEAVGVVAPPSKFRSRGTFDDYGILAAKYDMTMGPFVLSEQYRDDDSLDREELEAIPERLSPLLRAALPFL